MSERMDTACPGCGALKAPACTCEEGHTIVSEVLRRQGAFTQASVLRGHLAQLSEALHRSIAERDDLAKRLGAVQHELNEMRARLVTRRTICHDLEKELSSARARIEELEALRATMLNESAAGDAVVRSLTEQLETRQRQLLDQGSSLAHAQAENRAIRSLVDLTRAAFKKYGGDDEEWDSDTPNELLCTWDQFAEIFDRLS